MGKRKRKVFLWLKRPKKSRLINSPYKQCSSRIDGTPLKTPKETPVKKISTQKRCLTPVSSHKKTSQSSKGNNSKVLMQELWFLYSVRRTILIDISMKFHEYGLDGVDTIL